MSGLNLDAADRVSRLRNWMSARSAVGPVCEWCEASAREHEREYCVDHNAGADYLQFADSQRTSCRAGEHRSREGFEAQFRGPGYVPRPEWRYA